MSSVQARHGVTSAVFGREGAHGVQGMGAMSEL